MSALKIDLSMHPSRFASESFELKITKKNNFIFGKNGTGKTTIADEIAEQFADSHSVHVFKDFDGVAVNERLDAVALGTENAEIQKKIDIVDGEISTISKETEKPENDTGNHFTKAVSAKKTYSDQQINIENFYIESARQIKTIGNPNIASPNYDKSAFKSELGEAKVLTEEELAAHKDTIRDDKKSDVIQVTLPVIDLGGYLRSTNEILESNIKQPESIPELNNNPQKQQFAKTGLDIHAHKQGEVCAFCGKEITEERWISLGNYFSSEVKTLELRIETGITKLKEELKKINDIKDTDERLYYGKYTGQIQRLGTKIKLRKAEYKTFLESLEKALDEKAKNLFTKTDALGIDIPEDFNDTQSEYTFLIADNNAFSKNLADEQNKSKSALRYHEIQKKLDDFEYVNKSASLTTLNSLNDAAQKNLKEKQDELKAKQQERFDLISQTKDEKKISIKINKLLKNMGVASFELELVNDEGENQKGQYQVRGHDGSVRLITALSKGEKNIIAFLYFMLDLERADGGVKPKIVVLDDPMTSNDNTTQYIMIGEIQKFYRSLKDGNYFVLLTHNVHFYLNVRPSTATKEFYERFGVVHIFSNGEHSTIRNIEKGKNDFKTSYETLWKELNFLQKAPGATPDLLLSPCRRICETYMHFTKKSIDTFYGENTSAKKLFDVNQHSIDDLEAELNGKTKDEIREILRGLFEQNDAEDHFNSYYKENE